MKHSTFLKSVVLLTAGGLIAKGIGALYRIPLMDLLGGYGMGLYQMSYPLFCVLLTFSSAGIPSAFSRMIARETVRGAEDGTTVKTALKLFALIGAAGTLLMCLFAPHMAALQGDGKLFLCYIALSPSVFLVALIAVLRGYFQGKNNMAPTAVSEVIEQVVKAGAGLILAYRFRHAPALAVACTLLAVTASEAAAMLFLLLRYRREPRARTVRCRRVRGTEILSAAIPVMASSALLPLSQTVDSVMIVRLLSNYSARAVSLYGLFTGGAVALVSLPATVCYGFAAASVPLVARACAQGDEEEGKRRALFSLGLTLLLSLPCAVGLFVLAGPIVSLLYSSLSANDAATLVRLIRLSAVSAMTLAGTDTLAACLAGMGRAKHAALSMLFAVAVKFSLQYVLISSPAFGIDGAAIASNACYLIAFSLDLLYTVKKSKREKAYDNHCEFGNGKGGSLPQGAQSPQGSGRSLRAHKRSALGGDAG